MKNYGAAFNILSGYRIFLSLISIIFFIIILYLILRNKNLNLIDLYGYSFILGEPPEMVLIEYLEVM